MALNTTEVYDHIKMHFEHITFCDRILYFMNITRYDIHINYTYDVFKTQDDVFSIHLDVLRCVICCVHKSVRCYKTRNLWNVRCSKCNMLCSNLLVRCLKCNMICSICIYLGVIIKSRGVQKYYDVFKIQYVVFISSMMCIMSRLGHRYNK